MKVQMKPYKRIALLVLLFSTCHLFAAVQEIHIGNGGGDVKDLDPQMTTANEEGNIIRNLFEGLVVKDPKTADPVPGVALKWTTSKDGKKFTFQLNPNAKWSDGTPVTANDFVYSWTRLLDPKTASENAVLAHAILNGKELDRKSVV